MAKLLTPETSLFESVTCSRCCGTGQHSYNQIHGTRCYGCGGQGVKLTARGKAAEQRLRELCSKPARELQIGDKVQFDMYFFVCWAPIEALEVGGNGNIKLSATRAKTGECIAQWVDPAKLVRLYMTPEQKAPHIAAAKAYQASLTKAGTPRKRAAAAPA